MISHSLKTAARWPVLVLFNQPSPYTRPQDRAAEAGVLEAVGTALAALARAGYSVETLGLTDDWLPLVERLRLEPAVVVNFCEGLAGRAAGEAHVAGLLELMHVPYTGSTPDAILLCLNKVRTKRLLAGSGLPTPPFLELHPRDILLDAQLQQRLAEHGVCWPVIVKPAGEDASQGIHQSSVAQDAAELRRAAERAAASYGYPVLVEQYVAGREFNIAVIDDLEPQALPIAEIVFDAAAGIRWPIVTYDAKWSIGSDEDRATVPRCPAELDAATAQRLAGLALEAVRVTGCRDYARIDLRLTADGRPFILEVNANPDLSPNGGLVHQLAAAGIAHEDFVVRLIERAVERHESGAARTPEAPPQGASRVVVAARESAGPRVELRPLRPGDRDAIRELLQHCGNFRPEEIEVGVQLVDEALARNSVEDYHFVVVTVAGRVAGYTCFGPVPLSDGVWDLYWIAVDPSQQGLGLGNRLHVATERHVQSAGGRLLLAETSSLPNYAAARAFYLRQGYQLLERLADFYRPGDDRLTFGKRLRGL
jgi:D-alanine-D-alanine ligase